MQEQQHNLHLEECSSAFKNQFADLCNVWRSEGRDRIPGTMISPECSRFEELLKLVECCRSIDTCPAGMVAASLYYLLDKDRNIVGSTSFRHYLNEELTRFGGHIGYWIHPDFRRRGYAKLALRLTLEKCQELGLKRVLLTCSKSNIASAKVIQSQGGVLENELETSYGEITQRYWIEIGAFG